MCGKKNQVSICEVDPENDGVDFENIVFIDAASDSNDEVVAKMLEKLRSDGEDEETRKMLTF